MLPWCHGLYFPLEREPKTLAHIRKLLTQRMLTPEGKMQPRSLAGGEKVTYFFFMYQCCLQSVSVSFFTPPIRSVTGLKRKYCCPDKPTFFCVQYIKFHNCAGTQRDKTATYEQHSSARKYYSTSAKPRKT